jgi:hypothetical protein
MRTATISASYESVQRYLRMTDDALGSRLTPPVVLEPIDAFILRQFVDCYPAKLAIVDTAAEATLGTSTVFWGTLEQVAKVLVVEENLAQSQDAAVHWKDFVADALADDEQHRARVNFLVHGKNALESEADLRKHVGRTCQLVVMIAVTPSDDGDLIEELSRLLDRHRNVIIVLTPLGSVGSCRNLESALAVCGAESAFQFTLLREISPFCVSSKLGLIHPKHNRHVPEILHRIQQFFDGNFDFLGLVEANVELQSKMQVSLANTERLQGELIVAHEDLDRLRRAIASRTEELEAAYATTENAKSNGKKATSAPRQVDEPRPAGQALTEVRGVMAWLKRKP